MSKKTDVQDGAEIWTNWNEKGKALLFRIILSYRFGMELCRDGCLMNYVSYTI